MKTLLCSPENFTHLQSQIPPEQSLQAQLGTPIRVDRFVPTWKEYPRPKWWRRWFLREKQKPKERVFWLIDLSQFDESQRAIAEAYRARDAGGTT